MDLPLRSPWLHQLNRKRPAVPLDGDAKADIAIVGGGIAGIATAYFILRDTDKSVLLVEADQVAHGATGHNAGQLVAEFERSFSSLVREFGMDLAAAGHRAIQSTWELLEGIRNDMQIQAPIWHMTGYGALSDPSQVLEYLADSLLRAEARLALPRLLIAAEWEPGLNIPLVYEGLYEWVPQSDILALLETTDARYIAAYQDQGRGCMNSALFCEQLIQAILTRWSNRCVLAEMTPVDTVDLHEHQATLIAGTHTITANSVVLCTNGFERIRIANQHGADINAKYHESIQGKIGYMAAFLEPRDHPPMANWYQDQPGTDPNQPYFYMTRRPYDMEEQEGQNNLISVGGPESDLPEDVPYDRSHPYKATIHEEIDAFMRRTYASYRPGRTEDAFFWHGLMGYTKNGIRLVGAEPCNPVLMYNLGCNGIGLLHSIYGGSKIASIIKGEVQEPSIFDPQDRTCATQ